MIQYLHHFSNSFSEIFRKTMLSSFPVEIILMSFDYLKFDEIAALAWTSKRIMSINAYSCEVAWSIGEHRSGNSNEQEEDDGNIIEFNVFNVIIRDSKERKKHEAIDSKVFNALIKYYHYCRKVNYHRRTQTMSWDGYVCGMGDIKPLADLFDNIPYLDIHTFLSRFKVETFQIINGRDKQQFWKLIDAIETSRSSSQLNNISCGRVITELEDVKRCKTYFCLRNGLTRFSINSPLFLDQLLQIPHFKNTLFELYALTSSQIETLPFISAKRVCVPDGSVSFRRFFGNLIQTSQTQLLDPRDFVGIKNEDGDDIPILLVMDSILQKTPYIFWTVIDKDPQGIK
ncbi:hypothetical protein WR25_05669 isoform E [Diploscapter pachys]|uniref:F-box domain-containing protein n=1 Tax=Diploscapter pachys TaxID=2018661 RepID=A0A2A2LHS6_9BILA|nr:hypothetical protein WR25_05669 isoform A [Diploscapter pachys]PAV85751.1 hypothetical protein WR25_05669 isoform C [Diploscapter pachys]PAV85752.1 hypothetical protein WR25_05669 isoform D [Diploscapter pachys]PAV85753.1 hypothetical protein WR25_05669 isoform E [Diploscapter pachys]